MSKIRVSVLLTMGAIIIGMAFLVPEATSIIVHLITPTLSGFPAGMTFDPVTNSYFIVTANPAEIAQVGAHLGSGTLPLVTTSHNPNAATYTNPMPLLPPPFLPPPPGFPQVPPSMINLSTPILLFPNSPASTTPPARPTGVGLDFFSNTLYITAYSVTPIGLPVGDAFIIVIGPGPDGVLLTVDDEVRYWNLSGASLASGPALFQPEGIAFHPVFKTLFVLDGQSPAGVFEFSTTGVLLNSFFLLNAAGAPVSQQPTGIAYDPERRLLVITDPVASSVVEFTIGGSFVATHTNLPVGDGTTYSTWNGVVDTVLPFPNPQNPTNQAILQGIPFSPPIFGPSNGGSPLTPAGGILSDSLSSGSVGTPTGSTGPGAFFMAPTGLLFASTAPTPSSVIMTISNVGPFAPPLAAPIVTPNVTDVFQFATQVSPADLTFSPPLSLTLPLNILPGAAGAPPAGTQVGLFVFGNFVQGAIVPQTPPFTVSGPVKAMGIVDPSGTTVTFEGVGFF